MLEKLHQAVMALDENGSMDFKPVLEAHRCTQDLLYHNYWSASRPRDEDYVDDVAKLIFNNKDVFGIDKPVDRSNKSVHQYEDVDVRDIKFDGKTILLRNCNESHVSADNTMDTEFCLTCGAPGHYTTDHESTYRRVKKTKVNTGKRIDYWSRQQEREAINDLPQDALRAKSLVHKKPTPDPQSFAQRVKLGSAEADKRQLDAALANVTTNRHQRAYTHYPKFTPRMTPTTPSSSKARNAPPGFAQEIHQKPGGSYVVLMEIDDDEEEEPNRNTPPFRKPPPSRWAGRASVAQGNAKRGKNKYEGRTGTRYFDEN